MTKKIGDYRFLLFLAVFFLVLPLVNFRITQDPVLVPRYFFTSLTLALFSFSFLLFPGRDNVTVRLPNILFWFILIHQVWMLISINSSINTGDATQEWLRMTSIWLFLLLCFVLVQNKPNSWQWISRAGFLALMIFTFYGAKQLFPLVVDYFRKGTPIVIDLNISSSLSNKNFFAEVITLLLPLQLINIREKNRKWMILAWTGVFICLVWIILLQTISSWLAVIVGFIVLLILSRYSVSSNKSSRTTARSKKRLIIGLISVVILGGVLFLYFNSSNTATLSRKIDAARMYWSHPETFSSTSNQNNNSVFERILIWKNSFRLIRENPVIGAGLNNWKILQVKYGVGGTDFLNTGVVHFEHPHNDYLLVWSEQGIPGLLLYVGFFVLLLRQILRSLKTCENKDDRFFLLLSAMAISGFAVLSFFGYPRSRYYVMLLLMCWTALIFSHKNSALVSIEWEKWKMRIFYSVMFLLATCSTIASLFWFSGEIHLKQAQYYQFRKNFNAMNREANMARNWFFQLDGTTTPVIWYNGMACFYSGNLAGAKNAFEAAERINPYHLRVLNDLATTYEQSGMSDEAIAHYKAGLQITPQFIEGLLNLSAAYFNIHQPDSALATIRKIPDKKLSFRDAKNYKTFLPAILYSVAAKDSIRFSVADARLGYLNYIANDSLLIHTFKDGQKSGSEFNHSMYDAYIRSEH
ncbi:MAG: O-antigen ligase family protein [Bacteroidia bacterium]